jgi:hypothetical protein
VDNIKKLADFIEENNISTETVNILLRFLEVSLDGQEHILKEGKIRIT